MVNLCVFFAPPYLGCTGLELPDPSGALDAFGGLEDRITELRFKAVKLIGWDHYTLESTRTSTLPFAVSVAEPRDYQDLDGNKVNAEDVDLVARFYGASVMHTAAPGSGSSCLAAVAAIPGTVPNRILAAGELRDGKGGALTFGHPSGTFMVMTEPALAESPNEIKFRKLAFPRTARIICDGTVYIKNERPPEYSAWQEMDEVTAASFFLRADDVTIQR
jgi:2-methylaconitate cis-trans-isomerase PrpF